MSSLSRLLAASTLALLCADASAGDGFERIRQRGVLRVSLAQAAPAYAAGAKFRTPENPDLALAQDLARRLQVTLRTTPDAGGADLVLATSNAAGAAQRGGTLVPTGYVAAPMAILRSDTDIRHWEQLRGRTVCLSADGRYAGTIAARYGALEKVYKAPADALLALRTGACDAAVHDSALLQELLTLPEWKKFSATLPPGAGVPLNLALPAGERRDATLALLRQVTGEWQSSGYLRQVLRKSARSIAFEVYLDQDVPDCH